MFIFIQKLRLIYTRYFFGLLTIPILFCFFLTSCSTSNLSQKLVNQLHSEINNKYKIQHGELIVLYNLNSTNNKHLYNKEYYTIINDPYAYKHFINRLDKLRDISKSKNLIFDQSNLAAIRLSTILTELNRKYFFVSNHILSSSTKNDEITHTNLNLLFKLDNIARNVPIFVPMISPKITSKYGMRKHPRSRKMKLHQGIDIAGNKHAIIYSAADGVVKSIMNNKSYGNMIEISHMHGFLTRYAHLEKILVREGEKIIRGQKIGIQGKTGRVTREHLHYEIRINNKTLDPYDFIKQSL